MGGNGCSEGLDPGMGGLRNDRVWFLGIHAQSFRNTEEPDECSFLNYFPFKNSTDLVCNAEVIKS